MHLYTYSCRYQGSCFITDTEKQFIDYYLYTSKRHPFIFPVSVGPSKSVDLEHILICTRVNRPYILHFKTNMTDNNDTSSGYHIQLLCCSVFSVDLVRRRGIYCNITRLLCLRVIGESNPPRNCGIPQIYTWN